MTKCPITRKLKITMKLVTLNTITDVNWQISMQNVYNRKFWSQYLFSQYSSLKMVSLSAVYIQQLQNLKDLLKVNPTFVILLWKGMHKTTSVLLSRKETFNPSSSVASFTNEPSDCLFSSVCNPIGNSCVHIFLSW